MSGWARATGLLLVAAGVASPAGAQTAPRDPPPSVLGAPIAVQGSPVEPTSGPAPQPIGDSLPPPVAAPVASPVGESRSKRSAGLKPPTEAAVIPASALEAPVRTATVGPAADPVNDFLTRRSAYATDGPPPSGGQQSKKLGEKIGNMLGGQGEWFRSDHAFDGFVSPITNPFLAEDPRSLTELRPIFIYQRIPSGQQDLFGGNTSFFGTQARVAFTSRLSLTLNKLGGIWLNPNDSSPVAGDGGFAEVWLGPKYTFIRGEDTGSLLAGGLQFQLPVGNASVFQNTGNLSLVPYATYGQNFLRDSQIGSFNGLVTAGYSFGTNNARNDYFFLSGHLDLDVVNWHRFYPVMEMNYLLYTTNGTSHPVGSGGGDLYNFGGTSVKGNNLLTMAFGGRFKINEAAQFGGAFEFPLVGNRDLMQYRFTVDFILRY